MARVNNRLPRYVAQGFGAIFFSFPFLVKLHDSGLEPDLLKFVYRAFFYTLGAWAFTGWAYDFVKRQVDDE